MLSLVLSSEEVDVDVAKEISLAKKSKILLIHHSMLLNKLIALDVYPSCCVSLKLCQKINYLNLDSSSRMLSETLIALTTTN